jgi:hypothetical protein
MANLNGFDAGGIEPLSPFEPIPAGTYPAVIIESTIKPTKAGTGSYLELTFRITDGKYKDRLLWSRLNLQNPSDAAVRRARAELSAICRAVGVMVPADSVELHDRPLVIHVRCRRWEDTGEFVNDVVGFSKLSPQPDAPAATDRPPWERDP